MESDNEAPESLSLNQAKEEALRQQSHVRDLLKKDKDARKQRLREMALKAIPSLAEEIKETVESSPIVRRTFKVREEEEVEEAEGFIRLDRVKLSKLVPEDVKGWKQRLLMQRPGRIDSWRDRVIRKTASRK